MITPSKAHLIDACLYALRDDVPRKVGEESGPRAKLGTMVHLMVHAAVIFGSHEPPTVDDPEAMGMARNALRRLAEMPRPTLCEAGFLYDTRNDLATLGPARGEPGYDVTPPGCVRGTWDLVWHLPEEHIVIVWDLKTGKYDGAHPEQLRMQGIAASRLFRVSEVDVAFLFVRKTKHEMRGGECLDGDALDAEAGRLHGAVRRLPMAKPTPGDHCFRCDIGRDFCPAWGFNEEQQGAAEWQRDTTYV